MASVIPITYASKAVAADIDFLAPRDGHLFAYGYEPAAGEPPASINFEAHRVRIRDVRYSGGLTLKANGATLLQAPTAVRNFYDDDELLSRYYDESAAIIRDALGARRVVVFDHNVRRGTRLELRTDRYDQGRPVHHAHTDYTPGSAARRLSDELGAEARELAKGHYLQVNLWRPIRGPLRDAPLAICDGATVSARSLCSVDLLYRERQGEIYYLTQEPGQRWYYASDMSPDEAWLFKNFDSAPAGTGWVAPHSAFTHPTPGRAFLPRESIELRAFAFLDG